MHAEYTNDFSIEHGNCLRETPLYHTVHSIRASFIIFCRVQRKANCLAPERA